MRRFWSVTIALALACGVPFVVPGPAGAAAVDADGKVKAIDDGDTLQVDVYGDGTSTPVKIRLAGVQAMETNGSAPDDCHALQAKNHLASLVPVGTLVRLTARSSSSSSYGRPVRNVFRKSDGLNLGLDLIKKQYAFAFPHVVETTYNKTYITETQYAQTHPLSGRLWDNDSCGSGPSQTARVKIWVNSDSDNNDSTTYDDGFYGEWIKIKNNWSSTNLSIAGWKIRDTARNIYTFPSGSYIPPKKWITIYFKSGTNRLGSTHYWSSGFDTPPPIFENYVMGSTSTNVVGDAAYLVDPHGDIRARFSYPCFSSCATDALAGKVNVTANWNAEGDDGENPNGEWIDIQNTSASDVNLTENYVLETSTGHIRPFSDSTIHPGETLRVRIGTGSDSRLSKYWHHTYGVLPNVTGGDCNSSRGCWVKLRRYDYKVADTYTWAT